MNILGIETSCDETAAAVVRDGRAIVSNIVTSSLKEHKKYGGIIPEIASRRQLEFINAVVDSALEKAGLTLDQVQGIAVTHTPGLIGSLLVGLSYARSLSFAAGKPLVEIDHIKSHIYANFLYSENHLINPTTIPDPPQLPAIGLVVSGGHSSLYYLKKNLDFQLLGQTRDDAAGEAFDKVARILNLPYPGGPQIDRAAKSGENREIRFQHAELDNSFDFSFSGVKTAVLYYTQKHKDFSISKIAYAFQESVVSILTKKSIEACIKKKVKTLLIGGGVAANSALRQQLMTEAKKNNIHVHFPPIALCIDNAAMIAGYGYHMLYLAKGKNMNRGI